MNARKAAVLSLVAALALAVAGGAAFLRFGRAVPVPVVEAAPGRLAERVTGPGTVQARVPVTVSARITATVREVRADVGDAVQRGQVLVVLDDRDLAARRGVVGGQQEALARNLEAAKATVARAQAELELARRKHERDAELLRTGFLSPAALEAADAALKAALANLDNARATQSAREGEAQALRHESGYADTMLSFARIAAPMDGIVVARLAEAGSTVAPGTPLLRMVDPATLWVAARVDESVVGRVEVGQAASIRLRTGEVLAGRVARIARESDAATRELEVDVAFDVPPARFAIDQQADVAIAVGDVAGIVLPLSALTRDKAGRQGVLAVVDGRAAFRPVRTGPSDGTLVLVAHGVAAGERVVARTDGIPPGSRVRALDEAAL
ncbi:MAG TPA: efflux RND transporter periplasmic adaptor subunit [Albitalea sp.]